MNRFTMDEHKEELSLLTESIDYIDLCLLNGFSTPGSKDVEGLESLKRIFTQTPLEEQVSEAITGLLQGTFVPDSFFVLASIRQSLQGVKYNFIIEKILKEEIVLPESEKAEKAEKKEKESNVLQESISHWLSELAITGFHRLDHEKIVPFLKTVDQLLKDESLIRQSSLLTGFINEMLQVVPVKEKGDIPITRWADLWMRAMINTRAPLRNEIAATVSGKLSLLSMDVQSHDNYINLVFYGVLESEKQNCLVSISKGRFKVDLIGEKDIWLLFTGEKPLFEALQQHKTITIKDVPITSSNNLIPDKKIKPGKVFDPLAVLEKYFSAGSKETIIRPECTHLDRHPVHIAVPIFLNDCIITGNKGSLSIELDKEINLPICMERVSPVSPVDESSLKKTKALFGFIRFDNDAWSLQPMTLFDKGKVLYTGCDALKVINEPPKVNIYEQLKERAGVLLRA
ncbi:MAG: hypothetical protein GY754_25115 [bacterium]|nr:hypothetical protein [bacterium]